MEEALEVIADYGFIILLFNFFLMLLLYFNFSPLCDLVSMEQ